MKNKYLEMIIIILCCYTLIEKTSNQSTFASDFKNADKPFMSMGIGVDYASGDFGTGVSTDFISIPLIIDLYPTDRLDFEISIPFAYQGNSDNFYTGSGNEYQYHDGLMAAGTIRGQSKSINNTINTNNSSNNSYSGAQDRGGSLSGLGDTVISAGYSVIEEGILFPEIRLTGLVKIPTADSDKGLGSGSFDLGLGITISKWLGNLNLFFQERHIFCGSSDIYESEDHFTHEADIGYQFTDYLYGAISAYGATESYSYADAPLEGRVKIRWNFMQKIMLETYILKGFSDGSPDSGVGAAIFHNF